jgi:hypothetical protein
VLLEAGAAIAVPIEAALTNKAATAAVDIGPRNEWCNRLCLVSSPISNSLVGKRNDGSPRART